MTTNNGLTIVDCEQHGYTHLLPRPKGVEEYYNDDKLYTKHAPADWFSKEATEHKNKEWDAYHTFLANLLSTKCGLIDVGCGTGYFLKHFIIKKKQLGIGIEPSHIARYLSPIDHFLFDNIHQIKTNAEWNVSMVLVLEHVYDPVMFIREYIGYLGRQGHLLIVVPNENNPLQKRLGWLHWIGKVHINYFNRVSLLRTVEKAFFAEGKEVEVVYEGGTFPMEMAAVLGYNYFGNSMMGRKVHRFRLGVEKLFGHRTFYLYSWLYRVFGIGRESVLVVKCKNE